MLTRQMIMGSLRRFLRDERGVVVIDFLPVFFAVLIIVLTIFEIGVAYYLTLGAQKAAQLGARVAVTLPPIHSDVPLNNVPNLAVTREDLRGVPCRIPGSPNGCANPSGPWVCDGASLSGLCDATAFTRVVAEMRRTYPRLTADSVTITYINRDLGNVGDPFIPEVNVAINPQTYKLATLTLGSITGLLIEKGSTNMASISSSAFGENMSAGG